MTMGRCDNSIGSVRFGSVRFGSVRFGSVRFGRSIAPFFQYVKSSFVNFPKKSLPQAKVFMFRLRLFAFS